MFHSYNKIEGMASILSRRALSLSLLPFGLSAKTERRVAITIDDLPRGGDDPKARSFTPIETMTKKLLAGLGGEPAAAFINPGRAESLSARELDRILHLWAKTPKMELGNHTWNHPDLNKVELTQYCDDILKAEPVIQRARGGKRSLYFRHPFLHAGPTNEKREGLTKFLAQQKYVVAPVTIDTADWLFAAVYAREGEPVRKQYLEYMESMFAYFEKRSIEVLGREIAQTLLIHANQLNADSMPELIAMMKRRGYRIVSLTEALKDPLYQSPEDYTGTNGMSWIHRWGLAKGMKIAWEPDPPEAINKAFQNLSAAKP